MGVCVSLRAVGARQRGGTLHALVTGERYERPPMIKRETETAWTISTHPETMKKLHFVATDLRRSEESLTAARCHDFGQIDSDRRHSAWLRSLKASHEKLASALKNLEQVIAAEEKAAVS